MNFLVSFFVIDVSIFLFLLSSIAALSDLNLILAAPRLLPSSIFILVYIFYSHSNISATASVVIESSPQPNDVS